MKVTMRERERERGERERERAKVIEQVSDLNDLMSERDR